MISNKNKIIKDDEIEKTKKNHIKLKMIIKKVKKIKRKET